MNRTEQRRLLVNAANLIEKNGWTRGSYERGKRHCIYGAILECSGGNGVPIVVEERLIKAIGEPAMALGELAAWNDAQKTRRPVIAALRTAAANVFKAGSGS